MEMTNNEFLQIKNLEKIYPNGEQAVYDFNLDIKKNEFIVIVGPSGCGKSTTLRMVAGLEDVSAGEIYMDGELLNYKPCKDRKMAIVFQSYALYPQMSVYQNIAFPLTINKYPFAVVNTNLRAVKEIRQLFENTGSEIVLQTIGDYKKEKNRKKAIEVLAVRLHVSLESAKVLLSILDKAKEQGVDNSALVGFVGTSVSELEETELATVKEQGLVYNENCEQLDADGNVVTALRKMTSFEIAEKVFSTADILDLTQYLDKLPKELSGGQMQRVALGRAIVKNVPVFMMDEPLSNLDAKLRLTMRSEIVKLHNKINATTLYVTHDQTEAMTMASRIVVMSRGFVQQIGTPEEVYNNPVNIFVARFIGSPSMNVFDLCYDKQKGVLVGEDVEIVASEEFAKKYDEFYAQKNQEFANLLQNFDDEAQKHIRKIVSATDQFGEKMPKAEQGKGGIVATLKKLFAKKPKESIVAKELSIAQEKAKKLEEYLGGGNLIVGVRPERIKIEKYVEGKEYPNGTILNPSLCELLGAEYNVHFTYCGKNMIGKIDAIEKITSDDKIVVTVSFDDIYIFDPITGESLLWERKM